MRSLPPIILGSLLLAGCWSFQSLEPVNLAGDASADTSGSSDMGGQNSVADVGADTSSPADMAETLDMDAPDGGEPDMLAGWEPNCALAENVRLIGSGTHPQHSGVMGEDRLAAEVSLVVLPAVPFRGTLAFRERVDAGARFLPHFGELTLNEDRLAMRPAEARPDTEEALLGMADTHSVALGLSSTGDSERWAVSGNPCPAAGSENQYFWLWNGSFDVPFRDACPINPIWSIEATGGFKPYAPQAPGLAPGVVYFEDWGAGPALVYIQFDQGNQRQVQSSAGQSPGTSWIHATTGEVALASEDGGSAFYDVIEPAMLIRRLDGRSYDDPLGVAFEHLDGERYVIATIQNQDLQLQIMNYDGVSVTEGAMLGSVQSDEPTGLQLATFDGGFVLFFFESAGGTDLRWRVIPFLTDGDGFRRAEATCEFDYQFAELLVRDVDLSTRRDGNALQVFAAVSFQQGNTQAINVEGPHYPNFFENAQ